MADLNQNPWQPTAEEINQKAVPLRLLLVEDDEDDYVLFAEAAADVDYYEIELIWGESCENALELAEKNACDIFFVDYRLPGRSGLELLQELRGKGHHQPFILLTGQSDMRVDIQAMEQGAADYLEKDLLSPQLLERVVRYALSRQKTLDALRRSEKKLRSLSEKLIYTQEAERTRLARELHDSTSSKLTAIKYAIEKKLYEAGYPDNDPDTHYLNYLIQLVQETSQEIQRIYSDLRPTELDDLGVLSAVRRLCREFQKLYTDIAVTFEVTVQEEDIPEKHKIIIYRVLQEALNNIAKHSGADRVKIEMSPVDGVLQLSIADNGHGFDVNAAMEADTDNQGGGFGLISMKERVVFSGGKFSVDAAPGEGTRLSVSWPNVAPEAS